MAKINDKFTVQRKSINESVDAIFCDGRPHLFIQEAYVKGNSMSVLAAEDKFWKEYNKQIINYNITKN